MIKGPVRTTLMSLFGRGGVGEEDRTSGSRVEMAIPGA